MKTRFIPLASAAVIALGTCAATAEISATATTDLNLRMGPGPMYKVIDVIDANEMVMVEGCVDTANWCKVMLGDQTGWSYARYLALDADEKLALATAVEAGNVTVVEFSDNSDEQALIGGAYGAAAGALVAGPIGAIVGGFATAAVAEATVKPEVKIYAAENPVEPVLLNGEVVVGATIPNTVAVYSLPEYSEYAYLNVNGDTVIIDADTYEIVDIVR